MHVRAKFYVAETTQYASGGKVVLRAVCRGEDNKVWSSSTPVGLIELTINNESALRQFVPGDEVFVDFTEAPKGQTGMGDTAS